MRTLRFLVGAFIAFFSLGALAIDQNAGVQVTQLLKTKHTWNGAPIAYPKGEPKPLPCSSRSRRVAKQAGTDIPYLPSAWCCKALSKCISPMAM